MEVHYWEFVPRRASSYDSLLSIAYVNTREYLVRLFPPDGTVNPMAMVTHLPVYQSVEHPDYDVVEAVADIPGHPDTDHIDAALDAAWQDLHDGTAEHATDDEVAALPVHQGGSA